MYLKSREILFSGYKFMAPDEWKDGRADKLYVPSCVTMIHICFKFHKIPVRDYLVMANFMVLIYSMAITSAPLMLVWRNLKFISAL